MPPRQDLHAELTRARQELQQTQSRVAALEAQLFEEQPNHSDLVTSKYAYYHPLDALVAGCAIIGFDWRYFYINDAAAHQERYTKEELFGYTVMERHPGIEQTPVFAILQRCMHERIVERSENEVHYPDGSSAWVELLVQPVPEGIFVLSQEITARKRTESALLGSEQQFRLFMEHAPAAFAMLDTDMCYLLVSQRWLTDYRLSETNVIGRSHYALFPDLPARWKEIHQRCLAGAVESSEADPFPRADGSLDWVRWEIQPWRKLDGTIGGLLILSEVITERKQAEAQIRKLHRTLGVLSDINQAIVRIRHLPSLFEKACAIAVEKGTFHMAWIGLFDPKTEQFNPVTHTGISARDLEKLLGTLNTLPLSCALRTGEHLICNDMQNDPTWLLWQEEALRLGYRATVVLPLMVAGEIRGIFNLYAGETAFFDEQEMQLLDEMAEGIAFAIEVAEQDEQRQQAEAAVRHYTQRLEILHQIDLGIINAKSTEAIVETALQHIRQLIPCQRANVGLLDINQQEGVIGAVDYAGDTALGQGLRMPIGPDFFEGYDARHIKVVPDFLTMQALNPRSKQAVNEGLRSELNVLLMDRDQPIGTLGIFANTPAYFTTKHAEIISEVGSQLAIAIRQRQLSEQLAQHTATLEQKVIEHTAALQAALARVETILNNSPSGILLAHRDLSIQRTNSSFNALFECEQDAYFGKSLATLVHPDDAHGVTALVQEVITAHQGKPIEIRALRKNGKFFDAEVRIGLIKGDGVVCTLYDITERKAQERQLRYHASLQASVSDAVIVIDMENKIQSWNKAAEGIYGWTAKEAVGQPSAKFLHYEVSPEQYARDMQYLQEYGWLRGEIRQFHKDGHLIHIWSSITEIKDEQGKPLSFIAVNQDITERKAQERQLRYHAALQENVSDAVIATDMELRIQTWNAAAVRIYGWTAEEAIGKVAPDLLHIRFPHPHQEAELAQFNEQGFLQQETIQRRKDGADLFILGSATRLDDERGVPVGIIAINRDITERKRIAAELERQRSFLRNVIDVSPSIIFVKDYDGRFVLANSSGAAIYNTTIETLVGKTDADFCPIQQEADYFLATDRRVITSGEMLFVEEPFTNSTGKVHWLQTTKVPIISADGQSKYVMGVATDITERKEAEEALRASEEKYRSLVETMRDGLAVFDPECRVTFVNDRFCELLGYSSEEAIGKQPMSFVDAADLPFVQAQLEQRQSAESTAYELPVRHKDGHPIHLLLSGTPLFDKQGNYNGSLVVATDISLQKHAEETLRQALAKEKELGDLKTRFVSMASHEFRTPLATILALVETLSAYRKKLPDEQIEQRFDKIKAQIGYLKNIMEDVLMLARMQAQRVEFNPVKLDLDALCRNVLDEFQSQTALKHRLAYSVSKEIHAVLLDRKLMQQIINNLVSNALKYSPEDKVVHIDLVYTDTAITLKIRDEGIGIPEADLPHLFEPFHRAANVGAIAGTGLGLVITKEAVELHGGTITVDSQQGFGTTFLVRLPIAAEDRVGK